jgi:hypothetical protein
MLKKIEYSQETNVLTFYQANLVTVLIYHFIITSLAIFLSDRNKQILFSACKGRVVWFIAILSASMSIFNIVSHNFVQQEAKKYLMILEELKF